MLSAILDNDSRLSGVTDRTELLAASRPPTRRPASKRPWTRMSGLKISRMELRYSLSVRSRRPTSSPVGADKAGPAGMASIQRPKQIESADLPGTISLPNSLITVLICPFRKYILDKPDPLGPVETKVQCGKADYQS